MTDDVKLSKKNLHVGLIPDGNRRYALRHKKPVWAGHREGAKKIKEFINWCVEHPKIKRISVFALSRENLNRSEKEVQELWKVYKAELRKILNDSLVKKNGIQIRVLGDDGMWRPDIKDLIKEVVDSTKKYSRHILNVLFAYGSKFEISNAIKRVASRSANLIDRFLMVKEPLDLVIRTGKQHRLSNFMLYQASYAEIYFSDTLWPEFTKSEFDKIMNWYYAQQRRFGR